MSYSRFLDSNWYTYPTIHEGQPEIVCIRANGFDTYFWEKDVSYEEFIEDVGASMRRDEFYESDLEELKKILSDNMEDIKKELGSSDVRL